MMKLRPVMIAGTGSDVGKSVIAAGLCRILRQDGYNPAPFKAQNMALNSFVTPDGLEIGRAQAMQAEASGVECTAEMNPVLLKPSSDQTSQVILLGRPIGHRTASELFRKEGRDELRKVVTRSFRSLAQRFNPIVMEGAGSISEINLREVDLVNMPMAREADADIILVADIDRGGVFASVYGSIMLQNPEDRQRIKGVIINKFRGDISLFENGRKMLEELTGVPVLGVIPYFRNIKLDEEDSLPGFLKNRTSVPGKLNLAVVLVPHMSNFTDFDYLERLPGINLYFTDNPKELTKADFIILPGSKSTISDLKYLYDTGIVETIRAKAESGTPVIGICGGYQMLGERILDPNGVEGKEKEIEGIGLLPVSTSLTDKKKTQRVKFRIIGHNEVNEGYEIHMGITEPIGSDASIESLTVSEEGQMEGSRSGNVYGTYIHGILDNSRVVDFFLRPFEYKVPDDIPSQREFKEEQYDRLAEHLRRHIDVNLFYNIISK